MVNASKQIVTQSLVLNKHPLMFAQLPTSEGTQPNANEDIRHHSLSFAVLSTYTHFRQMRQTNTFICRSFGVCLVYVYPALGYIQDGRWFSGSGN